MKPMLAAKYDPARARFPLLGSVKVDGIRVLVDGGVALSRSLEPIPNHSVQRWVRRNRDRLQGVDGELAVGPLDAPDLFRRTSSGVMSADGEPDFVLHVFDSWDMTGESYRSRFSRLRELEDHMFDARFQVLPQASLGDERLVQELMSHYVEKGYEGLMLRDPDGLYKFGRATVKQGQLLKLKAWEDAEAILVGVQEEMHNANELTQDNLGHAKRSGHAENMVGKARMGAMRVRNEDLWPGIEFGIGTGFDAEQRSAYWATRGMLVGKIVKFKYFPTGSKEAPRFPVFLGFRDRMDL